MWGQGVRGLGGVNGGKEEKRGAKGSKPFYAFIKPLR